MSTNDKPGLVETRENGLLATLPPKIVSACENEALNLANLWTNGNEGARTCILAALLRIHAGYATPSPAQEPGTGDTGESVGPRTITTSRQTCEGCSALILKDWSFMGENDDRDSGTGAKCGAADGKSISAYWSVLNNTPDWCPLRATPATTAETPGPAEGAR